MEPHESEEDRDIEVFERIPWDSLKPPPDRRWLVYLGAVGIVLAAVGISIGRGMSAPVPQPPTAAPSTAVTAPASLNEPVDPPVETPPTLAAPLPEELWSEADLMAVPFASLEASVSALAEWFIVDWFTRDGAVEGNDRSFVEWSGVSKVEWVSPSRVEVTVLVRRLAAVDDAPYQRLPDEAWVVGATIDGDEWRIDEGPLLASNPEIVVAISALDGEVPHHLSDSTEGDPRAAAATDVGWLVEVDWVDQAGLTWTVRQRIGDEY